MIVKTIVLGWLRTNCYLLCDEQEKVCAVIDPGAKAEQILEAVAETGCQLKMILLTHGHYDHVMAAPQLMDRTGAKLYIHPKDRWLLECDEVIRYGGRPEGYHVPQVDGDMEDGAQLKLGSLTIDVLHTPGHTAGSVTLLCGDVMFSGDTLFQDCCGRTDLESGSPEDMLKSLRRLAGLPGNYRVLPGHEGASSLDYERQFNPYLQEALRG